MEPINDKTPTRQRVEPGETRRIPGGQKGFCPSPWLIWYFLATTFVIALNQGFELLHNVGLIGK